MINIEYNKHLQDYKYYFYLYKFVKLNIISKLLKKIIWEAICMDINYLFQSIMKYVNNSIIITDADGYIEAANSSSCQMWKYSYNEFRELHISNLFNLDANQKRELKENIYGNLPLSKKWNGRLSAVDKNGDIFGSSVSLYPVENKNSEVMNYLVISENITEKESLIHELNLKNEELKNELRNTQLNMIQEGKMSSLGQLSAGIAHEINNPLGFIISNFGTLKKYTERLNNTISLYKNSINDLNRGCISQDDLINLKNVEKKHNLDFIMNDIDELLKDTEDGTERIRKIIEAMRNFTHLNMDEQFEQYDLNNGITNTLVIARNELKYNSNIETVLGEIPLIEAQSSEINQVILNIIINASHAIKEKRQNIDSNYFGLLNINTFCDNSFVYCTIEDNGIGIPEKNLSKVFQPFFTTKPVGKGTGLGLSIAYDIIKNKHKGDLMIKSTLGVGTKFTIKLPINQGLKVQEDGNE